MRKPHKVAFRAETRLRHTYPVPLILAHVGHWYMWILYAVPALIVLVATVGSALSQRKAKREGAEVQRNRA